MWYSNNNEFKAINEYFDELSFRRVKWGQVVARGGLCVTFWLLDLTNLNSGGHRAEFTTFANYSTDFYSEMNTSRLFASENLNLKSKIDLDTNLILQNSILNQIIRIL